MERIIDEKEKEYLENYSIENFERPSLATDIVVFRVTEEDEPNKKKIRPKKLQVLLIKRASYPFMGYYVLCGMFLQNIGRFFEATMVTISENGMFLIPSVLILPKLFGLSGLIWCRPAASALALCFSLVIGIRAWRIYINTPSHINSNIQES